MIIGINGYSGSGKDTVGKIIQELCPKSNWQIKKFAGKLKEIASLLTGISAVKFEDQEFKKTLLGSEWGTVEHNPLNNIPVFENVQFNSLMSVRDFLQKLGTDGLRNGLHPNVWVNALMADYTSEESWLNTSLGEKPDVVYPNWIITDTRFPNEAQAIKDKGGIIIRVERPFVKPINDHPSEVGLDHWKFDYKIANISDLISLEFTIMNILKDEKILLD